jgi:hypothetical protein
MLRTIPGGVEVAKSALKRGGSPCVPPPPGLPRIVPSHGLGTGGILAAFGKQGMLAMLGMVVMLGVAGAGALTAGFLLPGHPDPAQPPSEVLRGLRSENEEMEREAWLAKEKKQTQARQTEQAKAVAQAKAKTERAQAEQPPRK